MATDKYIDWEKDENGLEVGKWTVSTIEAQARWQEVYDAINTLELRIKQLETKTK